MNSLSHILLRQAKERPDKTAVMTADGTLSFAELEELVLRCATLLRSQGVTQHKICGLAISDPLCMLIAWLALGRLRVGVICLPPGQSQKQAASLIKACSVGAVLSNQPGMPKRPQIIEVSLTQIKGNPLPTSENIELGSGDIEYIINGSGSTGTPKLIAYQFGVATAQVTASARAFGTQENDVFLSYVSLNFGTPFLFCMEAFSTGAAIVMENQRGMDAFEVTERYGVTVSYATVYHAELLLSLAHKHGRRFEKMRLFEISASVVTDALVQRLKESLTENVVITYDSNECWPVTKLDTARENRPSGSVGRAISKAELQIVNNQDEILPANHPGWVRMRSPGMMAGYIGDQEGTRKVLRNGWFYPGDIGELNEEGHLILLGRSDHMMICNGVNIYPAEIEQIMADHPAVKDVAVMPMQHSIHQDIPICAVALHADQTEVEAELLAYGRKRLGGKAPPAVFIVDNIPRNQLGKLVRKEMAAILSERVKKYQQAVV
ncbi:MAG: hypothetical protein DRR42_26980 [Gammaproteobacteria bacterium]|nr:MAG: hypothetical protein DRR42_26980 [Gammaproteobacteria bacterium]